MIDRTTLLESMPTELWLGGLQVPASTGARFAVHDPATDAVLIEVADASPADGARALDDAVAAQASWAATPARERAEICAVLGNWSWSVATTSP